MFRSFMITCEQFTQNKLYFSNKTTFYRSYKLYIIYYLQVKLGQVAQSIAHLAEESEIPGLIPGTYFHGY